MRTISYSVILHVFVNCSLVQNLTVQVRIILGKNTDELNAFFPRVYLILIEPFDSLALLRPVLINQAYNLMFAKKLKDLGVKSFKKNLIHF